MVKRNKHVKEIIFMEKSFMEVIKCYDERENIVVRPMFIVRKTNDLVIKDGKFYAMWDADEDCWVKDICEAAEIIDNRIMKFVDENCAGDEPIVELCKYYDSGIFKQFAEYCTCLSDNFYEVYCPEMM